MLTLQNISLMLIALFAGASFVIQQAVNSNLRFEIGSPWWAGFFSYLGGTIVMLIMIFLMRDPIVTANLTLRSSLWSWTGGLFGAIYIAISILLLPRLGIFTVVALIVVGQLITSVAFDHFGVMNVPIQPITITRGIGAGFLLIGAILIRW
ncbi:DMT family transporter [Desulfovibrionaceae bacterium CB1MN]|uniref:DMT family transporter n=1 Tax=Hydrosulfovibrio ferrireducens TaxID=2934181 RepID=UPI002A6832B2|nr:DMT family transporter [Desulfocapsaceae bacterium]